MSTETTPRSRRSRSAIAPLRPLPRHADGAGEASTMLELEYARGRLMARPGYVRSAPRGKERKGQLYLLLDLEGEAAPEQSRRWEGRLADIFYRHPSGSITSALLRALQDVNEEIVAANQTVPDDEVCQAAVAGAVVRDDEVYFALVGRTVAFLDGPDGCDVLGRGEARPGERPLDSLGAAEDVEIQMFHRVIGEPWTIVLASSGALALRGATQALEANPTAPVAALRRLAESARPARPFTGIVVSSAGEEVDEETTDDDEDGGFGPRPDLDDSPERRGPRERRARFHDAPANRAARVTSAPVARHPSHPRPIEEDAEPDWEEIARSRRDGLGEPRSPVPQRTRGVVESREEPGPDLTPGCPLGPPSRAREGGQGVRSSPPPRQFRATSL